MTKKKYVFDTQALLILYMEEGGAERVASMLGDILERKAIGYISLINFAELYYILCRKSKQLAEEKEQNLRGYGLKVVAVKGDALLWKEAAILKANYSMSLADAFAAATAKIMQATLVIGEDSEFDGIKDSALQIERVS